MPGRARITTLVENTAGARGTFGEHGLSFWIEWNGRCVLFDTGQSDLLTRNAAQLGIDLSQADAIVLSHGHYDHTGGLPAALEAAPGARVFAHSDAPQPRFARNRDSTARPVGMTSEARAALNRARENVSTDAPVEVTNGLWVTGTVPRRTDFEDVGGPFFLDENCTVPDPLTDDQAVFFDTGDGMVVVLGCAHAGVVNTLEYVRELTHGRAIHTVMGGMHLGAASEERLDRTVQRLQQLDVRRLGPAHCTGAVATARLFSALPGRCFAVSTGTVLEFGKP